MLGQHIDIRAAETAEDVKAVKELFQEYADFLDIDLCFQNFDEEMARFPAMYDAIYLARVDGEAAAGVGLKNLGDGVCEMKRLYARADYRGLGLGRLLCERLIEEARRRGYRAMRLDTLETLTAAVALYKKIGFVEIDPYYKNPNAGVLYLELDLTATSGKG